VALSVGLVLAINFIAGARNTSDLLREKAVLLVDRLEAEVTGDLAPARREAQFLARVIAVRLGQGVPLDSFIEPLLVGALAASSQVDAVQFVSADLHQNIAFHNVTGLPVFASRDARPDALLNRAVEHARSERGTYWWRPEFVADGEGTYISAHAPVFTRGEFRGVVLVAVSVVSISRLTADLSARQGMTTFVFSGDRVLGHYLLAGDTRPASAANPTVSRQEISDEVIQKLDSAAELDLFRGELPEGVTVRRVPGVRGEDWVAITKPLPAFAGLDLVVGAYLREGELSAELDRLARSGLAGLAALLASVLIALYAARRLARPIRELATGARQVSALDLDKVARMPGSTIREIDEQARSFNAMTDALRWFERYVPKSLVRRLMSEGNPQLASEARVATVCFTDIAGYTQMTEGLSPQATADLLNRHFSLLAREVERHVGLVDKYMGDGMMAFWIARGDDPAATARAAAHAALDMADAIDTDNRQRAAAGQPPIGLRIGLHTGPVIVGNIGATDRLNYTVVGVTVNIAQRLEQFARSYRQPDNATTIVASGETARHLDPATFDSLGRHRVRGITGTVEIVRLRQPVTGEPAA
jgi:adenylate cyclase